MKQFCAFLQTDENSFQPNSVEAQQIQQWAMTLISEGKSARSVSRKISTLKSYWHFLRQRGYCTKNPTSKIILPKTNKPLPAFFKQKEMENALDESFLASDFEAQRDHLILEIFYLTGIRLSELIGIKDADFDLNEGTLRVTGKRNKQRIIPVSPDLCRKVELYIRLRNEEVDFREDYLLLRLNGQKLYPKKVYNMVHQTMSQISTINKRSPHVLRHSFATSLLNEGADINAVKELLGHSSLAATQVYTHTSFDELYNIYKQAHPRGE
jgi:integrase/recombinase XerC